MVFWSYQKKDKNNYIIIASENNHVLFTYNLPRKYRLELYCYYLWSDEKIEDYIDKLNKGIIKVDMDDIKLKLKDIHAKKLDTFSFKSFI